MKKIILIWDFDGPIGQINSTYPYNFNYERLEEELNNVLDLLQILKKYQIKACFAITGFSAEKGVYPYTFPELIKRISDEGNEIASHSWRHEWIPIHRQDQIEKSLKRSKFILEEAIENRLKVTGFVPPHNRPMSWLSRGAFSFGDRGIFPFFKMGDNGKLLNVLNDSGYKWVRISYKSLGMRLKLSKRNKTGRVVTKKGITIFENHYTGFDDAIVQHILNSNYPTYTISAHPLMLSFPNKNESRENLLQFLETLKNSGQDIQFVLPSSFNQ